MSIPPHALAGTVRTPANPIGLVLFAHGSGSSHLSPRNVKVAEALGRVHVATLLFDLLEKDEEGDRTNVFDIPLLAERLVEAVRWVDQRAELATLPLGFFGASTGSAAALVAAAQLGRRVSAVVSRGGRPDLAVDFLPAVTAPVQLIVGGADYGVIELNEIAFSRLTSTKALEIVPGATHLFSEAGALEAVIEHASRWFLTHLKPGPETRRTEVV